MGEVKRLIYQENIIPQSLLIAVLVKFAVFQKCDLGHDLKETFNLFIYLLKQFWDVKYLLSDDDFILVLLVRHRNFCLIIL